MITFDKLLFSVSQNGYLKGRSVNTTMFIQEVHDILNNNNMPLAILNDFKKSLDCMSHEILLRKLKKYGLRIIL